MTTASPSGAPYGGPSSRLDVLGETASAAVQTVAKSPLLEQRSGGLRELAEDLRSASSPGALTEWYGVDLGTLYSPQIVTATQSPLGRIGDWLAILAGFGIFIPLLITWNGVRQASEAFADLSAEGVLEPDTSFFSLWMAGFGGRTTTFGEVALMTFVALLVVALSYTFARFLQVTGEAKSLAIESTTRLQLADALSHAQRAISLARYGDQSSSYSLLMAASDAARKSSAQAQRIMQQVGDAAERSQAAILEHVEIVKAGTSKIEAATEVMASGVEQMRQALGTMQQESTQRANDLAAAHDRLSLTLTTFDDAAQRRYEASAQAGAEAMRNLAQSLADSQKAIEASLAASTALTHRSIAESSERIGADLAQTMKNLAGQLAQLSEGIAEMKDNYVMVAGSGQAQVEALEDLSRDLSVLVRRQAQPQGQKV